MSNATDLWEGGPPGAKGCCKPDRKDCTASYFDCIALQSAEVKGRKVLRCEGESCQKW